MTITEGTPETLEVHVYQESRRQWWADVRYPPNMCRDAVGRWLGDYEPNLATTRRGAIRKAEQSIARRRARLNDEVIHP